MAQIKEVRLVVVTDDGKFDISTVSPSPGGGNPRFVTAQLGTALGVLGARAERILTTEHGPQMVVLSPVTVVPSESLEPAAEASVGAPRNGSRVRFPDVYGENVFLTISRDAGIYEVVVPHGMHKGVHVQVNTDAARWVQA